MSFGKETILPFSSPTDHDVPSDLGAEMNFWICRSGADSLAVRKQLSVFDVACVAVFSISS